MKRPPRRYGYVMCVGPQDWIERRSDVIDLFRTDAARLAARNGFPTPDDSVTTQIVGLRLNSEGARDDRGELMPRIECDGDDPRAVEVELRLRWEA